MKPGNLILKIKYLINLLTIGKFHHRPYHCHFQVTRRCNFRCPSCSVWRDKHRTNELALEEIQLAAANLHKIGVKSIVFTGGEPLLRKDIAQIVEIFKKIGFLVRLQTNGYLLKEKLLKQLLLKGMDDIHISLDSLKAERFMEINGVLQPEIFKTVVNNIKTCAKLVKKYSARLFLTTILRPSNIDEVEGLYNFAKKHGCLIGFYGLEICRDTDEVNIRSDDKNLIPDERECEELKNTFIKIKRLKKEKNSPIFMSSRLLDDYINFYTSKANNMKWNCNAGEYYLELLPDGSIAVCNATPAIAGYNYKNLLELYSLSSKRQIFQNYRKKCSGCICTRQLEYLTKDFYDIAEKAIQYLKNS